MSDHRTRSSIGRGPGPPGRWTAGALLAVGEPSTERKGGGPSLGRAAPTTDVLSTTREAHVSARRLAVALHARDTTKGGES